MTTCSSCGGRIQLGLAVKMMWLLDSHSLKTNGPTPTVGALGAALAGGKLLGFGRDDLAGALGAAGAYAGGLAQFYHSGGYTKRLNGARGAESGVMAVICCSKATLAEPSAGPGPPFIIPQ